MAGLRNTSNESREDLVSVTLAELSMILLFVFGVPAVIFGASTIRVDDYEYRACFNEYRQGKETQTPHSYFKFTFTKDTIKREPNVNLHKNHKDFFTKSMPDFATANKEYQTMLGSSLDKTQLYKDMTTVVDYFRKKNQGSETEFPCTFFATYHFDIKIDDIKTDADVAALKMIYARMREHLNLMPAGNRNFIEPMNAVLLRTSVPCKVREGLWAIKKNARTYLGQRNPRQPQKCPPSTRS